MRKGQKSSRRGDTTGKGKFENDFSHVYCKRFDTKEEISVRRNGGEKKLPME